MREASNTPCVPDGYAERISLCREQIAASPYSHTVAAGWYAEDVPELVAAIYAEQKRTLQAIDSERRGMQALRDRIAELEEQLARFDWDRESQEVLERGL